MRGQERPLSGQVMETVGGVYRVRLDAVSIPGSSGPAAPHHETPLDGEASSNVTSSPRVVEASLRGRLKRLVLTGDRVVAGDRVRLEPTGDGAWTIEEVEPRATALVRAGPGGRKAKAVAANLDRVLVVLSAMEPPFQREIADRFLVLASSCDIPAALVVNKMDLEGADAVRAHLGTYRRAGYEVVETSTVTQVGLSRLRELMEGRLSSLVGPSGVGKSSLLHAIAPGLALPTRTVGRRSRRGRHTTVSARMVELPGGIRVVDTPGFSDVATWGVPRDALPNAFPEFAGPAEECRFRGCSHSHEPGCEVKAAVEDGRIDRGRYEVYLRLLAET
jgi:ribosome biogenesis GTPase / thiamine phosphate phosphatase